jgi:hypothetical protein
MRSAKECSSQNLKLHADALDTAEPFPGISQFELSNNLAENGMRPVAPDQNKQPRSLIGPSPWHEATMGSDNRASS